LADHLKRYPAYHSRQPRRNPGVIRFKSFVQHSRRFMALRTIDATRPRHIKVVVLGEKVSDTRNAVFLFEEVSRPRYYLSFTGILAGIFTESKKRLRRTMETSLSALLDLFIFLFCFRCFCVVASTPLRFENGGKGDEACFYNLTVMRTVRLPVREA
jgi:hypothetical protein